MVLLSGLCLQAQNLTAERKAFLTDSLENILSTKTTPQDSIGVLYDIFDLSRINTRHDNINRLLATTLRGGTASQKLDVIRRNAAIIAASGDSRKRLAELIDMVASMPQSQEQRTTLVFLRAEAAIANIRLISESERHEYIHDLLRTQAMHDAKDPYEQIEYLFLLCKYLQSDIPSEQLSKYLDQLGELIDKIPDESESLQNLYLVQSSLVYSIGGQHKKAVEACRSLLKLIDQLTEKARLEGRNYRNYDTQRYVSLRRLLSNYKELSEKEVEEIYASILDLAQRNPDVQRDYVMRQRTEIYYLMKKKRYAEALDILKTQINNPGNSQFRAQLLESMLESAQAIGDRGAALEAAIQLNEYLKMVLKEHVNERNRELDFFKEPNTIQKSKDYLVTQQRKREHYFQRLTLTAAICGVILLLIIIAVLLLFYRKSRKLYQKLRTSNNELKKERDNLQHMQKELIEARDLARKAERHKTEFIDNMSHEIRTPLNAIIECSHMIVDNVDPDRKKYLKRYANMIDVSVDMLNAIVNDVLDIAQMDNNSLQIRKKPESANAICTIAVDSMRKHAAEGVEMEFIKKSDDINIVTDARRVEQVLTNLLSNAAKFTEEGHIHLDYTINHNDSTITFSVSDTGIGVPEGKEEIIFRRFEKLSNLYSGIGLGLNICRMISEMLGGTVVVDTTYPGPGARFLFTIPI